MKLTFSIIQLIILILQSIILGAVFSKGIFEGYPFTKITVVIVFFASILINIFMAIANAKNQTY